MLVGIGARWKQIVAYFLTGNKTDGSVFKDIIVDILNKVHGIGLTHMALCPIWVPQTRQCGEHSELM